MKKTINKMWKVCMEKLNKENFENGNLKAAAALILAVILTIGGGCALAFGGAKELPERVGIENYKTPKGSPENEQEVISQETVGQEDEKETREEVNEEEKEQEKQALQKEVPEENSMEEASLEVPLEVNTSEGQAHHSHSVQQDNTHRDDSQSQEQSMPNTQESQKLEDPKQPVHNCTYKLAEEQAPTCTEEGFRRFTCEDCGKEYTMTIKELGHDFAFYEVVLDATDLQEGLEKAVCVREGCDAEDERILEKLPHDHAYSAETERIEASCEQDGFVIRVCRCGETEREILPAKGHQEAWEVVEAASCTEAGTEALKCKACNNIADIRSIPALGHTEGEWIVDKEPSCTENGSRHKVCGICGETTATETLEAKGHSYGEFEVTTEPGCTTAGEKTRTCSSCGEKATISIDAKGHSYGDWIVDTEATEEEAGQRHKECAVCGDQITEEIEQLPKHEHDFAESDRTDSTCTAAGSITYTCSGCGEGYKETIPMKSHEAGEWKTEKEPTEQETGLRVKKCVNCGTEIETEVLEKLPHIHEYDVKRTEAGCETDGKVEYTCQCGHTYQEVIKATGHNYMETEVVNAVCGKEGCVKSTCAICGNERIEELPALEHDFGEWEIIQEARLGKDGERIRTCEECGKIETEKIDMLLTDGVDSVYYVEMSDGTQKMVIGHYDTVESDMIFELVNEMREENGLAPLARADFQDFSETRALELAVLWGHDRPNGKMFSYAENVAMAGGFHSADYAVAQYFVDNWENSSGHKANMLSPNAKYTGVAVFYNMDVLSYWETGRKSYEVYSAQNFSAFTREQKNQIIHGDCEDL